MSNKLKESENNTELKKRKDDTNQTESNKCEDTESKTKLQKKDDDKKLNEPNETGDCEDQTEYDKMKHLDDNQGSGGFVGQIISNMDEAYPFFKNNMDSYLIKGTSSSSSGSTCDCSDASPYTCELPSRHVHMSC